MATPIEAVFEHGVFRPLVPVDFDEGVRAEVTVHALPGGTRFADRRVLPEFAALAPLAGDSTGQISADRNAP